MRPELDLTSDAADANEGLVKAFRHVGKRGGGQRFVLLAAAASTVRG